ncbi:uncharacterized protein LOC123226314 [Mangifera indica]|uniref:uncharacterized protein LOC123226314 n=1 Tax=Mangifera indica TaxID=29780 RepID=UPI001CFA925E|nr:uncharacterized protein LOC123226314 [Mangifera indica]
MQQNFYFTALLILMLFIFSSNTSARFIVQKQGLEGVTGKGIASEVSPEQMENLMGIETCENEDEECLQRRLISEAHLDYIYTQKLKPCLFFFFGMYLYPPSPSYTIPNFQHFLISLFLSLSLCLIYCDNMKQNFCFTALIFLILFLFSSNTSALFIVRKQGLEGVRVKEIASEVSTEQMENLMGIETCENGDEECLKGRLISEAHLDYIYTQKLKP